MKLIIGLGNVGELYASTKHNIGFMCIDYYLKKYPEIKETIFLDSKIWTVHKPNNKFIFVKPQKNMNLSGVSVKQIINFFKLKIEDCLFIFDEINLPIGKYKLSYAGSPGGHNGIKNIVNNLNTQKFLKLKIGVRNLSIEKICIKEYVLSKFSNSEIDGFKNIFLTVEKIIDDFVDGYSFEKLMNIYNTIS